MAATWQAVPTQPFPRGRSQAAAPIPVCPKLLRGPGATLHSNRLERRWRRPAICVAASTANRHLQRSVDSRFFGRQKPDKDSKTSRLKERHVHNWQQFLTQWEDGSVPSAGGCIVVLCGAAAGNVGSVLRSCAVLGVSALCVFGMDYLSREDVKKIVNVSQIDRKPHWGTKLVPVPNGDATNQALSRLRVAGFHFVGLTAASSLQPDQQHHQQQQQQQQTQQSRSVPDALPLWEVDLTMPRLALVFGRDEDDGEAFPHAVCSHLDIAATIPMQAGTQDMLNLSSSVAAVVYEWRRQLAAHSGRGKPQNRLVTCKEVLQLHRIASRYLKDEHLAVDPQW
mmetsp:Transcript_14100/g.27853  ORF Transcript_14100/g.27853 Transcript_14100/m.27853 type:complete len:338 (+) Transcript_14100:64-1077(+)